jgi:glycogen debranching enzyme
VSRDDPAFAADRMWRGPVWVNTAWLLAHGLRLQGHDTEADALEEAVLRLVLDAGGPAEYFNPDTRRRATGATRCFGWSAALFLDLAVRRAADVG